MTLMRDHLPPAGAAWRKFAVLVLAVAVVGLPVNHIGGYALLLFIAVLIFSGEVTAHARAWLAAVIIVAFVVGGQWFFAPPRIDEGHNVFLPDTVGGALQRALPADVYHHMVKEFDMFYPPAVRCKSGSVGCWQESYPAQAFAFSADGIFHKSDLSRAVTSLDFSDPVWLRLGFVNDMHYNWFTAAPDVHRVDRDGRFYMGLHRWHLAMPWFELIRLPEGYVGGELCWRGEVMWEDAEQNFAALPTDGCHVITSADAGRRVFGIAIKPAVIAMQLNPPWRVRCMHFAHSALVLLGAFGLITLLVRVSVRRTILPFILIGLAMLVIAVNDASFIGGVRPFDRGDDGLFYDGVGRAMLQHLLAGDVWSMLRGGENIFYYGGPGLRYFRALEHVMFGESYLGYLSLVLLLPILVLTLFRRFLPERWSIALALVFTAIPVGTLFGTSFIDYARWAARGFADPAAYILFVAALLPLIGARESPRNKFTPAFFSALLFALAITMRPVIAPCAAVMLGGGGLVALYRQQWRRFAGLCCGFLPVFGMALHNYVYGHVFVLFSANATTAAHTPMQPSAYLLAEKELLSLDVGGSHVVQGVRQIMYWLAGPSELIAMIPLHAAAIVILLYVAWKRGFDPWLRLIALAALAQHIPAFFYAPAARYYYLAWFLTALVCVVWAKDVALPLLLNRYPRLSQRAADHPLAARLASSIAHLQSLSA